MKSVMASVTSPPCNRRLGGRTHLGPSTRRSSGRLPRHRGTALPGTRPARLLIRPVPQCSLRSRVLSLSGPRRCPSDGRRIIRCAWPRLLCPPRCPARRLLDARQPQNVRNLRPAGPKRTPRSGRRPASYTSTARPTSMRPVRLPTRITSSHRSGVSFFPSFPTVLNPPCGPSSRPPLSPTGWKCVPPYDSLGGDVGGLIASSNGSTTPGCECLSDVEVERRSTERRPCRRPPHPGRRRRHLI
jgi:hypothetical protein